MRAAARGARHRCATRGCWRRACLCVGCVAVRDPCRVVLVGVVASVCVAGAYSCRWGVWKTTGWGRAL
eukprot:1085281-Prymnesium_polylepis.1